MKLSDFLKQENIQLNNDVLNIKTFNSNIDKHFEIKFNESNIALSDIECEVMYCYDNFFNKKKCLCIKLNNELEYAWKSCKELKELLQSKGYEFYIMDIYTNHGYIPGLKELDINEIKEYTKTLKEDWYLFIQINDKLIVLTDDPKDTNTGYFMYNDYMCYIFNVNLDALIKREQESLEKYILEYYEDIH